MQRGCNYRCAHLGKWGELMVFWRTDGTVTRRELYHVGLDPREEGRDIANEQKPMANTLETILLDFLESVDAETPSDIAPNRRRAA